MNDDDRIGERFQELTKYGPGRLAGGARPVRRPEAFKEYPGAKTVSIAPEGLPEGSLWEAMATRRSRRNFTGAALGKDILAQLIWAAQGTTARAGSLLLRTAPSAGALYPIETYVAVNNVAEVMPGIYHYNVPQAALELVREGDPGPDLARAALGQAMCARAAAVFVWTAMVDRCKWKYAQRAYRYIYLDAAHVCGHVYLAAEDLGLGCCGIAAFFDDDVNALLGLADGSETAVYLAAVGPVTGADA